MSRSAAKSPPQHDLQINIDAAGHSGPQSTFTLVSFPSSLHDIPADRGLAAQTHSG